MDACRGAPGAVRIARALVRLGAEVWPLAGAGVERWAPADALHYATGRSVLRWPEDLAAGAEGFDAVLLAPAGAGLLRKLALGIRDTAPAAAAQDALEAGKPLLVAPPHGVAGDGLPADARALPGGFDAHGAPDPEPLAARVAGALGNSPLRGRAVRLVVGGAFAPVDAMRVLAGQGDPALARAAWLALLRRGAEVEVVVGPWAIPVFRGSVADPRRVTTLDETAAAAARPGAALVVVEEAALPRRTTAARSGKLPSGQAGMALTLEDAPAWPARLGGAPVLPLRRSPGEPPERAAERLAADAERAL